MSGPNTPLLIRALFRLYPKAFRDRYQAEYEAFLTASREDAIATGRNRFASIVSE